MPFGFTSFGLKRQQWSPGTAVAEGVQSDLPHLCHHQV